MKLIYGTTNKGKIDHMHKLIGHLDIKILGLNDVAAPKLHIAENGSSPLENARIKALAYYDVLQAPVFSADSGLYIDELAMDDPRQPGINVRGPGDHMDDDTAIAHYAALAASLGGQITARYVNAICLILAPDQIYEHMGDDIASEPFIIASSPHPRRKEGFPLDSLSIHIQSGEYYYDMDDRTKYVGNIMSNGFAAFFCRTLGIYEKISSLQTANHAV